MCSTQTYESLEEGCDLSPDACDRPGQPFMTLVLEPGQRVVLFPLLPRTGAWVARPQSEPEAIECATDQGAEAHDMMTSWQISPRPQTDGADPKARKRNRETMQADEFVSRLREWQKRIPSVQVGTHPLSGKTRNENSRILNVAASEPGDSKEAEDRQEEIERARDILGRTGCPVEGERRIGTVPS